MDLEIQIKKRFSKERKEIEKITKLELQKNVENQNNG
jgi:hypothetical protein